MWVFAQLSAELKHGNIIQSFTSVCPLAHFLVCSKHISTTAGQIDMNFAVDIHDSQKMILNVLAIPWCFSCHYQAKFPRMSLKYAFILPRGSLSNLATTWPSLWHSLGPNYQWCAQDNYWLAFHEIYLWIFMVPRGWPFLAIVTLWPFLSHLSRIRISICTLHT